jgi:hypothetical protein
MARLAALALLLPALALAACGDDETTAAPEGPTGASGVQGAQSVTVEEYLGGSTTEQLALVEEAAGANPECEGLDLSPGAELPVDVAVEATTADPGTLLSDLVAELC